METPSSRKMTSTSLNSKKQQEESLTKSRPVLLDITNDSPVVGLAKDGSTPASAAAKSCPKSAAGMTPGSGETILRRQVNSLLQRVAEDKISSAAGGLPLRRPPLAAAGGVLGFFSSPSQLLAPTPANTPQVPNLSEIKEESNVLIPEQKIEITTQVDEESQITRTLLFDSPGKSEDSSSMSSAVTNQGTEKSTSAVAEDNDSSSAWSIQANASSALEDDDHDKGDFLSHDELLLDFEEIEVEEEECGGDVDDLCDILGKMTVNDDKKFAGRHTRFVYNSDGEMEGEEEVACGGVSPGVVVLKGLPVPEGKHLRFPDDEDEEDA